MRVCVSQKKEKLDKIGSLRDKRTFFPKQSTIVLKGLANGLCEKNELKNFYESYLSSNYNHLIDIEITSIAIFFTDVALELLSNIRQISDNYKFLAKVEVNSETHEEVQADILLKTNYNSNIFFPLKENSYIALSVISNHEYSEKARADKNNVNYSKDLKKLQNAFPKYNAGVISLTPNTKTGVYKVAMFDSSKYDETKANEVEYEKEHDCTNCFYSNICDANETTHLFKNLNIKNKKDFNDIINSAEVIVKKLLSLSLEQQLVSKSLKGIYRTNAVAGSGKTTVMVERCFNLLKSGYSGKKIYVFSFTDRGIKEIEERFLLRNKSEREQNGESIFEEGQKINFYSFNGLGQNIIKENYSSFGFKKMPELINSHQKLMMIAEASTKFDSIVGVSYNSPFSFKPKKGAFFLLVETIDKIKSHLIVNNGSIDDDKVKAIIVNTMGTVSQEIDKVKGIYLEYESMLKEKCLIDYADQIKYAKEYLSDPNHEMKASHIVCDEFQDSDDSHVEIINLLTDDGTESIMVVGDDAQAIYSFRGVYPDNMLNFGNNYPALKDLYMTTNYRCSKLIAKVANNLLKRNRLKIDKVLNTRDGAPDGTIELFDDELKFLHSIKEMIESKKEITIISRTNKRSLEWATLLAANEIPVSIDLAIQSNLVKAMLSLAKFFYTKDLNELVYFLTISRLEDIDSLKEDDVLQLNDMLELIFKGNQKDIIEQLRALFIDYCSPVYGEHNLVDFVYLIDNNYTINDLTNTLRLLAEKNEIKGTTTVSAELIGYKPVRCSTVHNAKGSEFNFVYLDMTDSPRTVSASTDDDEERRLLYVAVTRAKEELRVLFTKGKKRPFEAVLFNSCMEAHNELSIEKAKEREEKEKKIS